MTHEEMSLHTRQAMTGSLKKFMGLKPLSQITVSEICADCNLNRKTFYYHFEDIYDLLHWMLEQEALTVVKQFDMPGDYDEVISFVIDYVDDNSHILNCIYDSVGREGMKRFFSADFKMYIGFLIEEAEKEASLTLESSYRQFLCACPMVLRHQPRRPQWGQRIYRYAANRFAPRIYARQLGTKRVPQCLH